MDSDDSEHKFEEKRNEHNTVDCFDGDDHALNDMLTTGNYICAKSFIHNIIKYEYLNNDRPKIILNRLI